MRKILSLLLIAFVLFGCSQREDFYVFSFDELTLAPGYDDVEYLRLVFECDLPESLEAGEKLSDVELYFWGEYFGTVDIVNDSKKEITIEKGKISRLILYLDHFHGDRYKLSDTDLSESVKENCEMFSGEYIERNGYACAFGKTVGKKKNVVILYGDIFGLDQDRLDHIEIYVE